MLSSAEAVIVDPTSRVQNFSTYTRESTHMYIGCITEHTMTLLTVCLKSTAHFYRLSVACKQVFNGHYALSNVLQLCHLLIVFSY